METCVRHEMYVEGFPQFLIHGATFAPTDMCLVAS